MRGEKEKESGQHDYVFFLAYCLARDECSSSVDTSLLSILVMDGSLSSELRILLVSAMNKIVINEVLWQCITG